MAMIEELKKLEGMEDFIGAIEQILNLDDNVITDEVAASVADAMYDSIIKDKDSQVARSVLNFKNQELTKKQALDMGNSINASFDDIVNIINEETPISPQKLMIINSVCNAISEIIRSAVEIYIQGQTVVLFEIVKDGAKIPAYAHETDAGADIFCPEDVTIPARSRGTIIPCGFKMALKEGWVAYILPRSSTGVKTPLRLSNSVGVIDSGYRGEVGLIFDNPSSKPYEIHAGDRLAQMIVSPNYHFIGERIDDISTIDGDRNGGYGSTGE